MAIRTLPSRAIADASIQAVDIASNSISKAKIDADTRLGLQNDSIILDGTDGAGANKGDFLTLNGTDNSSTNADDRILFDETFIDKVNLFNINTLGSANQQLRVNSGGSALEFANSSQAFATLLSTQTVNNASNTFYVQFNNLNTTYGSTYNTLRIVFRDFRPETANREINIRVSATAGALDNGSNDYAYSAQSIRQGSEDYTGSANHTSIKISGHGIGDGSGNVAGYGVIDINGYNDSSYYAMMTWRCHFDGGNATTSLLHIIGEGYRKTTSALENVAIGVNNFGDNPGIHNGIFKLYGLNT